MRELRFVALALVLLFAVALLPAVQAAAATGTVTRYNAGDTDYAILNLYVPKGTAACDAAYYGPKNQGGEQLEQDGYVRKDVTPYVAFMVQAPAAGWYTFDPAFNIGHFDATPEGVYNMVISVNDSRYYVGPDITSDVVGTVNVAANGSTMEVYLDEGVNTVRLLPLSGPSHYYNRDKGYNVWVNVMSVGIDTRLAVLKANTLTLDPRQDLDSCPFNSIAYNQEGDRVAAANTGNVKNLGFSPETLGSTNMSQLPYLSYTLNAPADGYYDMDIQFSSGGEQHGADGYLILRVNGTNYRRWLSGTGYAKQNISVPLKKGDNTVVITMGLGMKGGTSSQRYEEYYNGVANLSWYRNITVNGGVTRSATQIDPKTVADAPLPRVSLEAEQYAVRTGPGVAGLTELPSVRDLQTGGALDRGAVPVYSFAVDAARAGTYTVRAVYSLRADDAMVYGITGGANDSSWDRARFEPLTPMSRTQGYSELTLQLQQGRNVIRILPVTEGFALSEFALTRLELLGEAAVTGVLPQTLTLAAAGAAHQNRLQKQDSALTGATGGAQSYAAVNGVTLADMGWYAHTLTVPRDGYYDITARVSTAADGQAVVVIDGQKAPVSVAGGRTVEQGLVELSCPLTAGDHTLLLTGVLGAESTLGGLTVNGGITLSATQIDPLTLGVQPAQREGGLVPGSVYGLSDRTLTGIPQNTDLAQFISNFLAGETATVYSPGGQPMTGGEITAGCTLAYPLGTTYTVASLAGGEAPRSVGADVLLSSCNPVGRLFEQSDALRMEMSASNITLTGRLSGDVTLTLDCAEKMSGDHSLYVEVDGQLSYFALPAGRSTLAVARGLTEGDHTIRIHKGADNKKDVVYIHSVTYTGTLQPAAPAARRIEFIGDSVTAGSGVFFEDCGYGTTQSWFIYANMVADAFGADHYSVANGGWRFTATYRPDISLATIYDDLSMHEDLGDYTFAWQPQLVVINLGTNDAIAYRNDKTNFTEASYKENIHNMLDLVRQKNPNAQIVWVYGTMLTETKAWIQSAVEEYAQTDSRVHYVYALGNTKGRGDHPDFDGHTAVANSLTRQLSTIMGWELPTNTHATGDCDPTVCQFCLRNAETLPLHTYTDNCDTTCNYIQIDGKPCEHTRVAPHTYANCEDTRCDGCGATRTAPGHSYTNDRDTTCNVCGAVREIAVDTVQMHRMYNPHSGEHHYTSLEAERDFLVGLGWKYEGVGWLAPATSDYPVYRLYNPNSGDHHYTMLEAERDFLVPLGWVYEGIGWYSEDPELGVPLHRLFNPHLKVGSHHYTLLQAEVDFLLPLGWKYENYGWYGVREE